MSEASSWREVLADVTAALGDEREARFMCEHAAGLNATEFNEALSDAVTQRMGLHVQNMVGRRLGGEPLQYVLGRWAFRHLDLLVDRRVLIPRPETELVAEEVARDGEGRPSDGTGAEREDRGGRARGG